jgi:predicted transcriptional regulator
LSSGDLTVKGESAIEVVDALNLASFRILKLVSDERLDVTMIAEKLGLSEPYVSGQIHALEKLHIIKVKYERGVRGIRKMCKLAVERIIIVLKP